MILSIVAAVFFRQSLVVSLILKSRQAIVDFYLIYEMPQINCFHDLHILDLKKNLRKIFIDKGM